MYFHDILNPRSRKLSSTILRLALDITMWIMYKLAFWNAFGKVLKLYKWDLRVQIHNYLDYFSFCNLPTYGGQLQNLPLPSTSQPIPHLPSSSLRAAMIIITFHQVHGTIAGIITLQHDAMISLTLATCHDYSLLCLNSHNHPLYYWSITQQPIDLRPYLSRVLN